MRNKIRRCIVLNKSDGTDDKQIQKGLRKCGEIYNELGGVKEIAIIIPTKQQVMIQDIKNALDQVIGEGVADELSAGVIGKTKVKVEGGGYLSLWTHQTFCKAYSRGINVIVAVYPSKGILEDIDQRTENELASSTIDAVMIILASQEDEAKWIKKWNPENINDS